MKCPVCKTECGEKEICPECGFYQVKPIFISKQDAEKWEKAILQPFRISHYNKKITPALVWKNELCRNPQVERLFNILIPVAKQNYASLGHICLIANNEYIKSRFIDELCIEFCFIKVVKQSLSKDCKLGDIESAIVYLKENELLLCDCSNKPSDKIISLLKKVICNSEFDVVLGKGSSARSIHLDVAPFSSIFAFQDKNNIPVDLRDCFDTIIDLTSFSKEECDKLLIREIAEKMNIQLTVSLIETIHSFAKKTSVKSTMRLLSDYLFLHPEIKQPINNEILAKIFI